MEKIDKYHSYDNTLKDGDVLVFIDESKKTIQKIKDGHKVTFSDGSKRDLWIIEDKIKGVIHTHIEKPKPLAAIISTDDFEEVKLFENKKEPFKSLATSYKELKKLLYHGGNSVEFYHITAIQNAIEIFSGDYFYSRESAKGHIKYDNVELNDITGSVMSTNYSWRLEKYARFYLNIKNKATYAMHINFKEHNSFEVIVALDFSAIWTSKTNVILSPENAHGLVDSDFDWSKYNIGIEKNIKNLDAAEFNLRMTFEHYDPLIDNPYLCAEILFYNKVSLENISHIYFKNSKEMDYFLGKLPYNKRTSLKNKCIVREELFW